LRPDCHRDCRLDTWTRTVSRVARRIEGIFPSPFPFLWKNRGGSQRRRRLDPIPERLELASPPTPKARRCRFETKDRSRVNELSRSELRSSGAVTIRIRSPRRFSRRSRARSIGRLSSRARADVDSFSFSFSFSGKIASGSGCPLGPLNFPTLPTTPAARRRSTRSLSAVSKVVSIRSALLRCANLEPWFTRPSRRNFRRSTASRLDVDVPTWSRYDVEPIRRTTRSFPSSRPSREAELRGVPRLRRGEKLSLPHLVYALLRDGTRSREYSPKSTTSDSSNPNGTTSMSSTRKVKVYGDVFGSSEPPASPERAAIALARRALTA